MNHQQPTTYAQNRIDYIVYHRPKEAAALIRDYGYAPPKEQKELAATVKRLVKRKGEPFIKDLVQLHPDRKLLLEATGHNSGMSSYCGCDKTRYAPYDSDSLDSLSIEELRKKYQEARSRAKENPEDKSLLQQVEKIWDELRQRTKEKEAPKNKDQEEDGLKKWMPLGIAFLLGIVLAKIS